MQLCQEDGRRKISTDDPNLLGASVLGVEISVHVALKDQTCDYELMAGDVSVLSESTTKDRNRKLNKQGGKDGRHG